MSYLSNKIGILKDAFMGNLVKLKVMFDIRVRKSMTLTSQQDDSIVVSLTSYGKRVRGSVPYTAYSLLHQTLRPGRVVLWLDEKAYNNNNIPSDLRFLCRYGLEVRFCKDIGSYTKIIYSLSAFPRQAHYHRRRRPLLLQQLCPRVCRSPPASATSHHHRLCQDACFR